MTSFGNVITTEAELRTVYNRASSERAKRKKVGQLDHNCRAYLAHATFVMIGTRSHDGTADVSPKGGPPGFVVPLDEHRLAIPDLAGNNLLDSFTNLLGDPAIGLLFMVPGVDETLRINGRGCITREQAVLDACAAADPRVRPVTAIGVEVQEAFMHCAKSFRRGSVWRPNEWPDTTNLPSMACILRDHAQLGDVDVDLINAGLEEAYATTMWQPGG